MRELGQTSRMELISENTVAMNTSTLRPGFISPRVAATLTREITQHGAKDEKDVAEGRYGIFYTL